MGRHRQHLKYLAHYRFLFDTGTQLICGICDHPIERREQITVDHIHPTSTGGMDHAYNFQPAHAKCNNRRGNRVLTKELNNNG